MDKRKYRSGVVASYNESRSFGIVKCSKTQCTFLVHRSRLKSPTKLLVAGQSVQFTIRKGSKGDCVDKIEVIEDHLDDDSDDSEFSGICNSGHADKIGEVVFYDPVKKYGIVKCLDTEVTFVAHHSRLTPPLKYLARGQIVTFSIGRGPNGECADHIDVTDDKLDESSRSDGLDDVMGSSVVGDESCSSSTRSSDEDDDVFGDSLTSDDEGAYTRFMKHKGIEDIWSGQRNIGEVLSYDTVKKYGVIRCVRTERTFMAHHSRLRPPLRGLASGQTVEFGIGKGPHGDCADDIEVIDEEDERSPRSDGFDEPSEDSVVEDEPSTSSTGSPEECIDPLSSCFTSDVEGAYTRLMQPKAIEEGKKIGEVLSYRDKKRYGMVKCVVTGQIFIAHQSRFKPPLHSLRVGQVVQFKTAESPKLSICATHRSHRRRL